MASQSPIDKLPRFRSPPYPAIPLDKAIERAAALYAKALHHDVPIGVLASAWGYKEKSGGLFGAIAALKQFGLLTDFGSGEKRRFKLSESALRIVRDPDPNSEKCRSLIRSSALAPKIHAELWDRYGVAGATGVMDVAVKSYLMVDRRDNGASPYSSLAADEVTQEYRQTMAFAGLLESDGVSNASDETGESDNLVEQEHDDMMTDTLEREKPPKDQFVERTKVGAEPKITIEGDRLTIAASIPLNELAKLIKKIEALKAFYEAD